MAKMGIEVTGMSEANLGAAKFVKQAVAPVPNTMLGMAAGMASDAYTGYQMADLEKKQEGVVTEYMDRNHGTAGIEAATLKSGIEGIWNNFDATIEDVNPIEKTLQDKLAKYRAAKDQGVMSPQEFSDRILATTREAINKNPGMYDTLKNHSQKMLDQSGITSILNQDIAAGQSADKALQKLQDHYMSQAGKLNRPIPVFSDGGVNFAALKADVDQYELQESLVQQSKNAITMGDNDVHAAALQWAQSNGTDIIHGNINNSMYKGITMLKEGTDWQTAASAIRMDLNMHRQDIIRQVGPFMNDPIIKEHLAYLDKQATLVEEMLTKQFTNEDGLKYLANTTQMFRDKDYMAYAKTVGSPESLKAWTGMVQAIGPGKYAADNAEAMGKMYRTIGDLANGVIGSMNTDYTLKANGTNLVADGVKNLAGMAATDDTVVPQLENMFKTINADLENPEKFKTKEAKFNFYTDTVRAIADPKAADGIKKMGGGAYSDAAKLVDGYMNFTIPDLNIKVADYEDKGVKVQMDVLPDGRTVFQTSDPAATRDLNARYAGRINDSLKAFANLMGSDMTTVAKTHFYEAYLPQLLGDKDLQPLAIQSKKEAEEAFKAGSINAEQLHAILAEGFGNNTVKAETATAPKQAVKGSELAPKDTPVKEQSTINSERFTAEYQAYANDVKGYVADTLKGTKTLKGISLVREIANKTGTAIGDIVDDVLNAEAEYRNSVQAKLHGKKLEEVMASDPKISELEDIITTSEDSKATTKAYKELKAYRLKKYGVSE